MSGADIDAKFRSRGGFSLTNLEGTIIVYYLPRDSRHRYNVTQSTPNLVRLRNFLVNQARLGR